MIWITSGDRPSHSRLALQLAGGFRRANPNRMKVGDWLINWGCSDLPIYPNVHHFQPPLAVRVAANKLRAFEAMEDNNVSIVPFTTDQEVVSEWLTKSTVVARTKLTGHSGEGIVIIDPETTNIPAAPLYTKYIHKAAEYRVHVVGQNVIDVQRKIRDPDREPATWKVRSHANGFIFARNNVSVADDVRDLCVAAVSALGLDFGAVDIVVDKAGKAYVLEVNTAPGLEGQTVNSYVEAFRGACR